jgi:hypothetical protein
MWKRTPEKVYSRHDAKSVPLPLASRTHVTPNEFEKGRIRIRNAMHNYHYTPYHTIQKYQLSPVLLSSFLLPLLPFPPTPPTRSQQTTACVWMYRVMTHAPLLILLRPNTFLSFGDGCVIGLSLTPVGRWWLAKAWFQEIRRETRTVKYSFRAHDQ